MNTHRRDNNLSIIEAVETLSHIADMEFDRNIGIMEEHELIIYDQPINYRTVHWLRPEKVETTIRLAKETFRIILNYLRNFYKKEYSYVTNKDTAEGIKTIMVLVGEAAKKLDKYTALCSHQNGKSVTELKEYKQLQEFYLRKIAHKIDEGLLGKWILALSNRVQEHQKPIKSATVKPKVKTKHIFVDLDSVKKDTEYELFFIRKEDGTRFFSPRLIRNIKLVCDFGDYFSANKELSDDPLEEIALWYDKWIQMAAKNMMTSEAKSLEAFFTLSRQPQSKDHELVQILNKALVALMLSANVRYLWHDPASKCCRDYFVDFQNYLRQALHSREYQRLVAYPPKDKLQKCILEVAQVLCYSVFCNFADNGYITGIILNLIAKAEEAKYGKKLADDMPLIDRLTANYSTMRAYIKRHGNGSLVKVLDMLEQGNFPAFDPVLQANVPQQQYTLKVGDASVVNLRIPVPVYQEFIHKPMIVEEFRGFLRSMNNEPFEGKHLMINLQDRTSWKEHSRCVIVEGLQASFPDQLCVVTLSKDSEFYQQIAPYNLENHADKFMRHFKEHLEDDGCGFFFPEDIKAKIFPHYIDHLLHDVHKVFFHSRNVLTREKRLDFIEIVYLFLEMKLLEIVKPTSFSMTCKDGLDVGIIASVQLFIFDKICKERLTCDDWKLIDTMLYGPLLLLRERLPLQDRFNRMISAIKLLLQVKEECGGDFLN